MCDSFFQLIPNLFWEASLVQAVYTNAVAVAFHSMQ